MLTNGQRKNLGNSFHGLLMLNGCNLLLNITGLVEGMIHFLCMIANNFFGKHLI